MWAKWHISDTKKSLPQFIFLRIKGHYEVPKQNTTKLSGFNDNYNLHMIYPIIIWFILLLLQLHTSTFSLTILLKHLF